VILAVPWEYRAKEPSGEDIATLKV